MVPGHAPSAGPGFDGRYNLGGDARINVGSRRRRVGPGHGRSARRAEGNCLPLLQSVTRKPASSSPPAITLCGVAVTGALCSRTLLILAASALSVTRALTRVVEGQSVSVRLDIRGYIYNTNKRKNT